MENNLIKNITSKTDFRLTKQRKKILIELLEHSQQHFLAQDIYQALKKQGSQVGLATVYRSLDLFEKEGIVIKRKFDSESAYYELAADDNNSHHHLICESCGQVIEVKDLLPDDIAKSILAKKGFEVDRFCLQIYGQCKQCSS